MLEAMRMRSWLQTLRTRPWLQTLRTRPWPQTLRKKRIWLGALALPFVALLLAAVFTALPPELREPAGATSVAVVDAGGHLLREVRANDGSRARWITLQELGPRARFAMLAAEDRRFFRHPGVDPVAVGRAVVQDVTSFRTVSGASTLTMQLARTVRPHPRTLAGKFFEMALALRIEWSLSKEQILEQYMNRVSFGPALRGMGAASYAYFDKPPSALSTAEAALLAGLPRGPALYEATRHPERAKRRRDRVLGRMHDAGWLTTEETARAQGEPLVTAAQRSVFGAPHLVSALVGTGTARVAAPLARVQPGLEEALSRTAPSRIVTTLDPSLQRAAEIAAADVTRELRGRGVSAAAVVAIDHASGDVLAYVGSPDFFDESRLGQNDGVRAARQPGSTLKPFLYGLAMEKLGWDGATVLPDIELHLPTASGDYAPRNYDGHFRGPVRLRDALGSSLNIPAVWSLEQLGVEPFLTRLRELGFTSLTETPDFYGPALALGDGEVTLLDLARAYATLARGGVDRPLRFVRAVERAGSPRETLEAGAPKRVMPRDVADRITDILKDHAARSASFGERTVLEFPFEVAAKTGTSKGYRDNWAVGYAHDVTVAAWVGNFDGTPMTDITGITGAGPLFHAVMEAAMRGRPASPLPLEKNRARRAESTERAEPDLERTSVCALSGEPAGPSCPHRVLEWRPRSAAREPSCHMHVKVAIDRRNGLRAGPACAPEDVEERIYEHFAPEYAAWATTAGRPTVPREWSPLCPGTGDPDPDAVATTAVRILYPTPGARFVIDPDRPRDAQLLDVQVVSPPHTREVTLRVDGTLVARTTTPPLSWKLEPGDHLLTAEADGHPGAPVKITVRDSAAF
ncbi:penicillin-binding protein 1C [Pendulispora albinea]|uniref:peptidoglycan glycosyltransferase n=1 Tax=Pendulispora albinea TaxID=2741071 RepID=A0ABZ2LYU1_9BACT